MEWAYDYATGILLPQVAEGLIVASALLLVALGLTLIFGQMSVINMAHGELYMLGAYIAYALGSAGAPFWVAFAAAPVGVGLLGVVLERLWLARLAGRRDRIVLSLLLTFGVSLVLRGLAQLVWGPETHQVTAPLSGVLVLGDVALPLYRVMVFAVATALLAGTWFVLYRTMVGAVLRATAVDPQMVASLGVAVAKVQSGAFFFGCALAGAAGVLLAPIYAVFPGMGHDFILFAFAVVIVGGMGSVLGAVVAGVLLTQVNVLASLFIQPVWAETLVFGVMLLVLAIKPNGLFGRLGA